MFAQQDRGKGKTVAMLWAGTAVHLALSLGGKADSVHQFVQNARAGSVQSTRLLANRCITIKERYGSEHSFIHFRVRYTFHVFKISKGF